MKKIPNTLLFVLIFISVQAYYPARTPYLYVNLDNNYGSSPKELQIIGVKTRFFRF